MRTRLSALAVVVALCGLTARADDPKPAPKADDPPKPSKGAYLLVIGVSDTADPTIQPRPTADADAKALYDLFADKKYLDANPERLKLLTSKADEKRKGQQATRENILKAVHEAIDATGKDDLLIIAWFGRGASVGDRTCLFAADSTFKDRAKNGVLGSDLETDLKQARQQKVLVMMDVHFKGFDAGKETVLEPTLREVLAGLFGGEEKGEQPMVKDRVFMLGTIPSADPLMKGENGLFATVVLDALKGTGDKDGYEPDGVVTVDELAKVVEKEMPDQSRALGKTTKEKESEPFIVGEETSHFAVTKNPKLTADVSKRLAAIVKLGQDGKITPEAATEGGQLLARMPRLKALQDLRKKYQELADGALAPADFTTVAAAIKKGMVLGEDEAERFTKKVMAAATLVADRYVKPTVKGDLVAAAVKGMYRRLEEPLPSELEVKLKDAANWKKADMEDTLTAARLKLGNREDLDGHKDADLAITMLMASLNDPFTSYIDKETIKKSNSALQGRFGGVGIQIRRDIVNDALLVASPIKGSPAYKAGIQAGDLIVGIKREVDPDGQPLKSEDKREFSTKGMKTEQALDIILGRPGIPITLVIKRDGEEKDYVLKRAEVTVETVLGMTRVENDAWNFWLDEKEKIAYIHLTQFTPDTIGDLATVMKKLTADGLKGLVLDLRGNPGGALEAAGAICAMFIPDGKVVTVRARGMPDDVLRASQFRPLLKAPPYTNIPMSVLVNGDSASASEIVSACLQDFDRAVVVGERTYGKGSVQTVRPFNPTEAKVKLTFARYFPPSDRNIDRFSTGGKPEEEWGVSPNKGYEVKLTREEKNDLREMFRDREVIPRKDGKKTEDEPKKKAFKDTQLEKAVDYVKEQIKTAKK
ncbi:MAG: S41 family peptidase [Fimbriiglobus sp.]|jgi:C-terminal peptidase prc|nr:S41 family peptidase [Fimbriiglobus sp.]